MASWNKKKWLLLVASYLFYAAWSPAFVLLLWLSTLIDWYVAKGIETSNSPRRKSVYLTLSLFVNIGLLVFFKYGTFFLTSMEPIFGTGLASSIIPFEIVLPVGISFYTFQTLSYTLDVYRGTLGTSKSLRDFALYVTFFPQLVAGPIVRASDFLPQCETKPKVDKNQIGWGLFLITLGLFEKVVLADFFMAPSADMVFGWKRGALSPTDSWIGALAFSGQIFFDFAGYSTCAIGAALCLGFALPDNFRFPYAASGFSDFWQRWHISLSSWLRDYLYISLGGNRKGSLRTMANLFITMLLGGLWHGAAWTFVGWGCLHGAFLVAERAAIRIMGSFAVWKTTAGISFLRLTTWILVVLSWVLFRSQTFEHANLQFLAMFGLVTDGTSILPNIEILKVLVCSLGLLSFHWLLANTTLERTIQRLPQSVVLITWAAMLVTIILAQGGNNAFIYFQF